MRLAHTTDMRSVFCCHGSWTCARGQFGRTSRRLTFNIILRLREILLYGRHQSLVLCWSHKHIPIVNIYIDLVKKKRCNRSNASKWKKWKTHSNTMWGWVEFSLLFYVARGWRGGSVLIIAPHAMHNFIAPPATIKCEFVPKHTSRDSSSCRWLICQNYLVSV
jgi:hypothetical protein